MKHSEKDQDQVLIDIQRLKKYFPVHDGSMLGTTKPVRAVDDVSFSIRQGEILGLVGESGSGKTTVGRTILRLIEPTAGSIWFAGDDITTISSKQLLPYRRAMQIIFQDPYSSLNPRMTVRQALSDVLDLHRIEPRGNRADQLVSLLEQVGLSADFLDRYPHECSGGQRQRIGIARALCVHPRFLVADEPVSALDVSVQAQVVNLLYDLKQTLNLTMLFIAHDLAVVRHISDRVLVMYLGKIMESAPSDVLYRHPRHPYTQILLSSIPIPDPSARPERIAIQGEIPTASDPPSGCVFRTRCPIASGECAGVVPPLEMVGADHYVACIKS